MYIYIYSKSLVLKKWLAVAPTAVGVPTGATLSWLAAFADREHDSPLDKVQHFSAWATVASRPERNRRSEPKSGQISYRISASIIQSPFMTLCFIKRFLGCVFYYKGSTFHQFLPPRLGTYQALDQAPEWERAEGVQGRFIKHRFETTMNTDKDVPTFQLKYLELDTKSQRTVPIFTMYRSI